MGIKTVAGTDPRSLMINNFARKVSEARGVKLDDAPEALKPNHMRLFSYVSSDLTLSRLVWPKPRN